MTEVWNDLVAFGVDYETGPLAITDLHAGGVFFCVVFKERIRFEPDGKVQRSRQIIDDSRSLDEDWVRIGQRVETGAYAMNDRGYLVLRFQDTEFTGLPCRNSADLLTFHVYQQNTRSRSLVYRRVGGAVP